MSTTSFAPRTGAVLAVVPDSDQAEVAQVLAAASAAAPAVAAASPATRRGWLHALADALEARTAELAALADDETALGLPRLEGEVARMAGQLRFYGDVAAEGGYLGVTRDAGAVNGADLVRVQVPLGVVAVFGASNFPFGFGVLGNDTASALAAGCPVVAKAHPAHPQLSLALARVAREALSAAGAPAGAFGLVSGFDAGAALATHDDVDAVAFTGSQAGGTALWRLANGRERVVPVFAEMGTVNPVVVTPAAAAARAEEVARGFVGSFTLGAGQFCTKPGLLLVPAGHGLPDAVARALVAADPAPVMLTRGIAETVEAGLFRMVDAGARVLARVPVSTPGAGWHAPAVVLSAPAARLRPGSALLEECFGAVALVVEYADAEERDGVLARLQGCLAAGVVAEDADPDAGALVGSLSALAGRVLVNDWPTGVAFTWAQTHGGPWPATSRPEATSVGAAALDRFVRPVSYQGVPDAWLPEAAREANPYGVPQRVDGVLRPAPVTAS
ncbi:aldehyde dehydrogenase family protein [Nocardioides sp. GY 10127]|uniref:aldehyde dehydrogenase family protein n=1 Tax=Nocardioides sp. GY 10127 TaxID=2569762 RepID=UPI0010A8E3D8|nr:aldehyde dehydrogenase family protein [Nocardioides sp. GY 10127]TIC80038.1 aldehyde dehydrogenase family protein [Nocardioides sp. GY 10127]